jgi:hypothetical protein
MSEIEIAIFHKSGGAYVSWASMNIYSVAYIDTVGFFFRYLPKGIRKFLEPIHGRRLRIDPCEDENGRVCGYRVTLHQPTNCTLNALDDLQRKHRGKLCRVDVAYDFSGVSRDWLERRLIMRWRRQGQMNDEENGLYLIRQKGRRRRSGRDICMYDDRESKITGELDVNHVELRLQNTETVRRQGFEHAGDLIDLNPRELFDKNIKLIEVDIEDIKWSFVRKNVRDERLNHLSKRHQKVSAFVDQFMDKWRASLPRRWRSQLDRLIGNRVQLIKDLLPNAIQNAKIIPVDVLGIPNRLDWVPLTSKGNFSQTG